MSKLVRIDEECEEILRKYSEGSINDCIKAMAAMVGTSAVSPASAFDDKTWKEMEAALSKLESAIKKDIAAMMDKYERGQKEVNSELIARLSSMGGHSKPQESVVAGPNGPAVGSSAFVPASQYQYKVE